MNDEEGVAADRVVVNVLRDVTYYATLYVKVGDVTHEVDARPSDALNLALRVGAPVFVAEELIDQAQQTRRTAEPGGAAMGQASQAEELPPAEWRSLTTLPLFKA